MNQKIIYVILAVIILGAIGVAVYALRGSETIESQIPETENGKESIIVVSPNGGEKWEWNSMQEIKWKFSPEMKRKINNKEIINFSVDIGRWHIYRNDSLDEDFTSMQWKVGNAGPPPGGFGQMPFYEEQPNPMSNEQYKIKVCAGTSESFHIICDESDNYFSIIEK